jgi:hypothetical protein
MTLPVGTVALLAMVTAPSASPAPVIEVVAAACVIPTTFGTVACPVVAPLLMVRSTADPGETSVPAGGLWFITLPADTVALFAVVTVPRARPTLPSAVVAAA